ncbi:hypothetical protein K2X33_09165, partial [bacterium]|nr:hypothetical protein [bacterium]
ISLGHASLKEKALWREAEDKIKDPVESFQKICETKAPFSFDKESFKGWDFEDGFVGHCVGMVRELESACEGSTEGKQAIQKQVKSLQCAQRAEGSPERHELKNGALRYTVAKGSYNSNDTAWVNRNIATASGTPELSRKWENIATANRSQLNQLNSNCETSIGFELDQKSFLARTESQADGSMCSSAIELVERLCQEPPSRKAVVGKIKKITCRATQKEGHAFASLSGGNLVFDVGYDRSSDSTELTTWLKAHL